MFIYYHSSIYIISFFNFVIIDGNTLGHSFLSSYNKIFVAGT
jgi:hypothetical protein